MTALDLAHVNRAPGQAVRECPNCHKALVDTGDGQWNHAIGVEPCGWKARLLHVGQAECGHSLSIVPPYCQIPGCWNDYDRVANPWRYQ